MSIAGVHFRYTSTTWTDNGWGALGATELAAMIWVWFVLIIGVIALIIGSSCCLAFLLISLLLCFFFTLAIAIWVFIGTQTRYWSESIGCNTQYSGFLEAWASVDIYLQAVDQIFCSYRCPCYVNRTTAQKFIMNHTSAAYYNQWSTFNISIKPTKFQTCNQTEQDEAYNLYLMRNAYYNNSLRQDWFHIYYGHVEEYFRCNGFCGTTYFNDYTGTNSKMVKYLFSDIGKGVPEHIGCLEPILNWLTKTLNAFGAVCLFLVVVLLILIIIVILLLGATFQERNAYTKSREKAKQIQDNKTKPTKKVSDVTDNDKDDDIQISDKILNTSFKPSDSQMQEKEIEFNPSVMKP